MSLLLLWIGLVVFVFGCLRFVQGLWFRSHYIQKWGQVVGFAEESRGLYSVVLRFQGINDKDYFLVDREKSAVPKYVMGEFIPILVSRIRSKHCLLFAAASTSHAMAQILTGVLILAVQYTVFGISKKQILLSVILGLVIWILMTAFSEQVWVRKIKHLKLTNFLSHMREPLILEVEKSKLIKWTTNFSGVLPEERTVFDVRGGILKLLRPVFLLATVFFVFIAVYSLRVVQARIKNSVRAGAVYDGAVHRKVFRVQRNGKLHFTGIMTKVPVFRYYDERKVIRSGVDLTTPFVYDLEKNKKIVALIPKDKKTPVFLDRGLLNYWLTYFFFFMALLMLLFSSQTKQEMQKTKKKSPIFFRRAI